MLYRLASIALLVARQRLPLTATTITRRSMSTSPAMNHDGSLNKFPTPVPINNIEIAAAKGDVDGLSKLLMAEQLQSKRSGSISSESGNTPLIWAADAGRAECVKLILDRTPADGSINEKGFLGNTAISRAARGGHADCVSLLLERDDIDPNICNDKKQYPLHFAAFKENIECVQIMLESKKCDAMVKDRKGRTPAEDTSVEEIRDMIMKYREEQVEN